MSKLVPTNPHLTPREMEDVHPIAVEADRVAQISDREAFRVQTRAWLERVDSMSAPQLIALIAYMAAAADPNPAADRAIPARLKSLRESVISLLQVRTTAQLENTIIHLDESTERLNKTVLGLTVVGVILTAVQAAPIIIGWFT